MSATLLSLLAFVVWTMLLVTGIVMARTVLVLTGQKAANEFPADRDHGGSDLYKRALRAHLNCLENLPLYTAVVVVAVALNATRLTDTLAFWFIAARVAQTTVHLIGTTPALVTLRAGFLLVQLGIVATMIYRLVALA